MTSIVALAFALLGSPLFVIIAALALVSFVAEGIDPTVVFIEMYRLADTPALSAIPLFALAGFVLAESGAARRLVQLSNALLGWLPGGLGIVAVAVCALLTAFTGASGMTIVAVGGLLLPALQKSRYPESFSLGLLTTSGSLGLLFPPSIPLILYGIVSGTRIDDLFLAGAAPGLLLVGVLCAYCFVLGRRLRRGTDLHTTPAVVDPAAAPSAAAALKEGVWELLLPVVVISGIYSGTIAVSEAAALSVLYVLVVEMAIHREITWRDLPGIIRKTMVLVGLGSIGSRTAKLASALGMRVLGVRRNGEIQVPDVEATFGPKQLLDLLPEADFLVLAMPLTHETQEMIGERELRAMKPTAYLVNIGRGGTIQEGALVRALADGWIAGAGLDVFASEPLAPDSPLWEMENVVITAHYAGATSHYQERAMGIFLANLRRYRAGEALYNVVQKDLGY